MIVEIREKDGLFTSIEDFCSRVSSRCINKRALENLIKCGAFDSLGYNRAQFMSVLDQVMELGARKQKDIASGQMDLFSEFMDEDTSMDKITMPKVDEFPKIKLLNMEKEITGFYITGHPLEEYKPKIHSLATIESLAKEKDGKYISIAGIIRKAKRVTTKKGDMMCFLELEDFLNVIEVIVFPKTFYDNINNLVPDMPVVIRGKLDKSDDEIKVIADKVFNLEEYTPEFFIMLSKDHESEAFLVR